MRILYGFENLKGKSVPRYTLWGYLTSMRSYSKFSENKWFNYWSPFTANYSLKISIFVMRIEVACACWGNIEVSQVIRAWYCLHDAFITSCYPTIILKNTDFKEIEVTYLTCELKKSVPLELKNTRVLAQCNITSFFFWIIWWLESIFIILWKTQKPWNWKYVG